MTKSLLLAADLLDALANPYRTIEEHESGAARLSTLAARGARVDITLLGKAIPEDADLLPDHLWRWALQEAKSTVNETPDDSLPGEEFLDRLYDIESDRMSRLLLVESVMTHPLVEQRLSRFDREFKPLPLAELPKIWPRARLIRLSADSQSEDDSGERTSESLAEFGMLLLQVGTPAALAFLGGTIVTVRDRPGAEQPLIRFVREFVDSLGGGQEIRARLGLGGGEEYERG